MNLLLNTHTFLWFVNADAKLSANAKALIEDPANRKYVSVATCWEIAIKVSLQRLKLGDTANVFVPRELAANHFDLLPIGLNHALFVENLPHHHGDPFDRLLTAQSQIEAIPIVSIDQAFDSYGVKRLW